MILCDMDGVLALGPEGDTGWHQPIFRAFSESPEELDKIHARGIPLHLVTAKVEGEALQVLQAIGLDGHFSSVIGADRLFWPAIRGGLRRRRVPESLAKSAFLSILPRPVDRYVVMIDDRSHNLVEMMEAGSIDFGILVPPIICSTGHIESWFDLNLAFRLARELTTGRLDLSSLRAKGVTTFEPAPRTLGTGSARTRRDFEGVVLSLPSVSLHRSGAVPIPLESLDTGACLLPCRWNVVTVARTIRSLIRTVTRARKG